MRALTRLPWRSGGTVRSGRLSRALDFHAGRLVLLVSGWFRRLAPRKIPEPARIGLCAFGAIGDALLSSAIVFDLKRRFPAARVVMLVTKTNAGVVPLLPHIDGSVVLPLFSPLRAIRLIRRERFDLLIDANQWLRISAIYCAFGGARYTVGFRTPKQCRHYAFDRVADHKADRHELENYRELAGVLGVVATALPRLGFPLQDSVDTRGLVNAPYVVLHPWAGGGRAELKEWPAEHWIALARSLGGDGYKVVVTGAPGDAGKTGRLLAAAARAGVHPVNLAGRLNLGQTASLLSAAELVVSVNTGIMHIAATIGVPLVALHGPTNPKRWGPIGSGAINLVPDHVRAGYLNLGFEFPPGAEDCMKFIPVAKVVAAARKLLRKPSRSHALADAGVTRA
jgi:ADP-heptose:LPS heptosyltransferase